MSKFLGKITIVRAHFVTSHCSQNRDGPVVPLSDQKRFSAAGSRFVLAHVQPKTTVSGETTIRRGTSKYGRRGYRLLYRISTRHKCNLKEIEDHSKEEEWNENLNRRPSASASLSSRLASVAVRLAGWRACLPGADGCFTRAVCRGSNKTADIYVFMNISSIEFLNSFAFIAHIHLRKSP